MPTSDPKPYRRSLLRQTRSVNTRQAIARAAAQVWGQMGYEESTIEDICAAAGVGRSTYYLHFTSKEELLIELALATAMGVATDVEARRDRGSIDDEVDAFVDGLVRRMERVPKSLAAAVMRRVSVGRVAAPPPPDGPVLFEDVFEAIVRTALDRGEIRSEVPPRQLGEVLAGMTLDALERWAGGSTDLSLGDNLRLRFGLVLAGLKAAATSTGTTQRRR